MESILCLWGTKSTRGAGWAGRNVRHPGLAKVDDLGLQSKIVLVKFECVMMGMGMGMIP